MSLITRNEVKTLLQLTGTTKDALIDQMIVNTRDFIVDYCNNYFLNENFYYTASTISFYGKSILDSASGFVSNDFVQGLDVYVDGSDNNDGFYNLGVVAAGSMVTDMDMTKESAGNSITIYQVKFPPGLKQVVANMIGFQISKSNVENVQSESIGNYSVTYASGSDYPKHLLKSLRPYKRIVFK